MEDASLDPQQQRDRRLASQPRRQARYAMPVADLVGSLMSTPQIRRLKRQSHLTAALSEALPPAVLQAVSIHRWSGNTLTLLVDGSPLLAEIRQFHESALLAALMRHGLGVSQLRLQLKGRQDPGRGPSRQVS